MDGNNHLAGTILGALVADAASVGFHWLYDQKRIKDIAPDYPEFRNPPPSDYNDVPGYYAHGLKKAGEFSQYGEQAMVLLRSLVANGGKYDKGHYEKLFCEHFGYGGQYVGYIDHPTRDTLNNVAGMGSEITKNNDKNRNFHGADDEQLPALAKLPALIAVYQGKSQLNEVVESSIRVTNNNNLAVEFGLFSASIIETVLQGQTIETAILDSCKKVAPHISEVTQKAISLTPEDNLTVTSKFGTSCKLVYGFPSVIHNALTSDSYTTAIRKNIYAGGDSCGRAMLLGALLGAAHGIGGAKGIPLEWIEKLTQKDEVESLVTELLSF